MRRKSIVLIASWPLHTTTKCKKSEKMSRQKKQSMVNKFMSKTAPFFEKVGSLSKPQRLLICLGTIAAISAAYIYFIYMPKQQEITKLDKQYSSLKQKLNTYKNMASHLKKYEKMIADVQGRLNLAIKALPDKKEIPSLIKAVSKAGTDAGLVFTLFKPGKEVKKGFYAEIPVQIKIKGGYHQIAHFFDQVSRLYRIVTIRNINIRSTRNSGKLDVSCTAVTYKFVKQKPKKKGKRRHRRKR